MKSCDDEFQTNHMTRKFEYRVTPFQAQFNIDLDNLFLLFVKCSEEPPPPTTLKGVTVL